jgi:hypothetical protein
MSCYVRGCREEAVLCARHRFFGLIETCAFHNPVKIGYDRPLTVVNSKALAESNSVQSARQAPRRPTVTITPKVVVANPF